MSEAGWEQKYIKEDNRWNKLLYRYFDVMATVRKMKEMVPDYMSNNSICEKLD